MSRIAHSELPRRYIPTLDGWRAVAIVLVILVHDSLHRLGPIRLSWPYNHGAVGVDVFFAISGILICTLLLDEEEQSGTINLGNFYIRRAFRILPPAFIYLAVIAFLRGIHVITDVHLADWLGSAFFFRNYQPLVDTSWYTGHFWSLSVEEHFYLFLPAFLIFCKRLRAEILLCIGLFVIFSGIAFEHFLHHSLPFSDFRLGALLIAASTAIAIRQDRIRQIMRRTLHPIPLLGIAATASTFLFSGRALALAIFMALLVASTILSPKSPLSAILESRFMRFIGKRSYSLYLWHVLFVSGHFSPRPEFGFIHKWSLQIPCAFLCACVSYTFVEQPMIQIGRRVSELRNRAHGVSPIAPSRVFIG